METARLSRTSRRRLVLRLMQHFCLNQTTYKTVTRIKQIYRKLFFCPLKMAKGEILLLTCMAKHMLPKVFKLPFSSQNSDARHWNYICFSSTNNLDITMLWPWRQVFGYLYLGTLKYTWVDMVFIVFLENKSSYLIQLIGVNVSRIFLVSY